MINVYVIGDDEPLKTEARQVLQREGLNCPPANVTTFSKAPERLETQTVPLVVVILPREVGLAQEAIDQIGTWPERQAYHVIGLGPVSDPHLVMKALRGHVNDYLDQDDLDHELVQSLDRYRTSTTKSVVLGRVIAILSSSGGCGSSTVAVNLATLLAQKYQSTLLIDLHLATCDLAALLDLKPDYSILDLCTSPDRLDRELLKRVTINHKSGVSLLAAPRSLEDINKIDSATIQQIVTMARSMYPFVILDLDYDFQSEEQELLRACDTVALVMRLDFVSLRNSRRLIDHLERVGLQKERIRLIVNRQGLPRELPTDKVEEVLGMKIAQILPDDPRTVNQANNCGVPVVIEAPSSKVARGLGLLATSMNGLAVHAEQPASVRAQTSVMLKFR